MTKRESELSGACHDVAIRVCDDCVHLRGQMCHVPECVFCRWTMDEVRETLDKLNICPIIDGVRHVLVPQPELEQENLGRDDMSDDRDEPDFRGPAVIVSGSILGGFKFIGPFDTIDLALQWHYASSLEGILGIPVTVVLLDNPESVKVTRS